ncbi:MAG: DNA adenine methylase [Candidatus Bruticola sp.]
MTSRLTPFVKWAGGKKQLLDELSSRLPEKYKRYYEPFIGGGAFFLHIQPTYGVISDVNEQLLNVYIQLRNNAEAVIDTVEQYDSVICTQERYLLMRELYNRKIIAGTLDIESASLTIWINKHCFNGLYRVNSRGLFNVPYNRKVYGSSIEKDNLLAIGAYLRKNDISIRHLDFASACADARDGDFIYFDSPYVPLSPTANFADYAKGGFSLDDHKRLAVLFRELDRRGVYLMLSNNNVPIVHELYASYRIETIEVRRNINCDASKRKSQELIIRNY